MLTLNIATLLEEAPQDQPNLAGLAGTIQCGGIGELLGYEWLEVRRGYALGRFTVERRHLAPTGFLAGASVIGLLDLACGLGCAASLPKGATSLATIELKTNFLGTAREGMVTGESRLVGGRRTTQVWDAEARAEDGRTIALFRCTQSILYPRS